MFRALTDLFQPSRPEPLAPSDARIALAALMVRVAKADHDYDAREIERILSVLMHRYGISREDADSLRQKAEDLEANAPDTVRFTRAIKEAVPHEDREEVVEALWAIALADGSRDAGEDGVLRLVVNLLGVTDRDSALARQRVLSATN